MGHKSKVPATPVSKLKDGDARVHFDLSRAEFLSLLKIVTLGENMANAARVDDRIQEYQDIDQLILGLADREGFSDLVELDGELGEYFPTRKLEETVLGLIEEFEEDSFWEEATFRLAERDLIREFGEKKIKKLPKLKYVESLFRRAEKYAAEFDEHGLARLEIVASAGGQTES